MNQEIIEVNITEVLHSQDPRWNLPEFVEAKRKEKRGLLDKGTWMFVLKEQITEESSILTGKFVSCVKNFNTDQEVYNTISVLQGHKDNGKKFIVHD